VLVVGRATTATVGSAAAQSISGSTEEFAPPGAHVGAMGSPRRHIPIVVAVVAPLVLAGGLLAGCGPASAGTVAVEGSIGGGSIVKFTAAQAKNNNVTVTVGANGAVRVEETGGITPGAGCTRLDATTARCTASNVIHQSILLLLDGDDTAVSFTAELPSLMTGGTGNDVLTGGGGSDRLFGAEGSDTLSGGAGDDHLAEGVNRAEVEALDVDTFNGGPGVDSVSYGAADVPLSIDLDGVADDGQAQEGDNVKVDVERLFGGSAGDELIGSAEANEIFGYEGEDTIVGNGGSDRLVGENHSDLLLEGIGATVIDALDADTFEGGGGVDTASYVGATLQVQVDLDSVADDGRIGEGDNVRDDVENVEGGGDGDILTGDGDANILSGGGGIDRLTGNDGRDDLIGGAGDDRLVEGVGTTVIDALDADDYRGGDGVDTADYQNAAQGVTVNLNNQTDDGRPTEGDNVRSDVENVTSGNGADVLTGDGDANRLSGVAGVDIINGLASDDILRGSLGLDALDGGEGTGDDCDAGPAGPDGGTEVNCER
jgi:Ca2+-binding RTX toxin-like protein